MVPRSSNNYVVFECVPLGSPSNEVTLLVDNLCALAWPAGAELRITLHADSYLEPFLEQHSLLCGGAEAIYDFAAAAKRDWIRSYGPHKKDGPLNSCPLRNFRLFVALYLPISAEDQMGALASRLSTALEQAGLAPARVEPEQMSEDNERFHSLATNPECQAPVALELSSWTAGCFPVCSLAGGFQGLLDDQSQHLSPFIYSITIAVGGERGAVRTKKPGLLAGRARRVAYRCNTKIRNEAAESGIAVFDCCASMLLYGCPQEHADKSITRSLRVLEATGAMVQRLPAFDALDLSTIIVPWTAANCDSLKQNWFSVPAPHLQTLVPFTLDPSGPGGSFIAFGRHGQLASFSLHDQTLTSRNWFMSGSAGSGKSFLTKGFLLSLRREGVPIRVLDIGGEHKFLNDIGLAAHYDLNSKAPVSVNPFPLVREPEQHLAIVGALVADLLNIDEVDDPAMTSIMAAVVNQWQSHGPEALVKDVLDTMSDDGLSAAALEQKHQLCQQLSPGGMLAPWLSGTPNFDFLDPFLVVDMEHLRAVQSLLELLTPALIALFAITCNAGVFGVAPHVVIDEAWYFYGRYARNGSRTLTSLYDASDRNGGAVGVVTQSLLDLKGFLSAGPTIRERTTTWFYLESADLYRAKDTIGLPGIATEEQFELLLRVRNNRPRYLEFWISAPWGCGPLRLVVCPYEYSLCTSDSQDRAKFKELIAAGKALTEVPQIMGMDRQ